MRSYDEIARILALSQQGLNPSQIALQTNIPRATVRDCVRRYSEQIHPDKPLPIKTGILQALIDSSDPFHNHAIYAYVLGLYLGDGNIAKVRNTYRLRITLDQKYPQIITLCIEALQQLMPHNQVHTYHQTGCIVVSCYSNEWVNLFPQHGAGAKHNRPIILEDWQQTIVDQHPLELLRGLYHSDGSRSRNVSHGRDYPRYFFSNTSDDIRAIYTHVCDVLNLAWTQTNPTNIAISRREDVSRLDSLIGGKG